MALEREMPAVDRTGVGHGACGHGRGPFPSGPWPAGARRPRLGHSANNAAGLLNESAPDAVSL